MKFLLCSVISIIFGLSMGLPILDLTKNHDGLNSTVLDDGTNSTNGSNKDYYVIRAVIYEIGILTDSSNDDNLTDSDDSLTHQRVDLSFFDAQSNGSDIDLGDIPLPIQTNVSGQVITGISPVHIGDVSNISEILSALPLTATIVNITQSDTSVIKLSTHNQTEYDGQSFFSDSINDLTQIPSISNSIPVLSDAVESLPSLSSFSFN